VTGLAVESRRFWRIVSPRWHHAPLSGDGAARHGGRWNRPGVPALYMSETLETAVAEYQQELGVRPGTFVVYEVAGARAADLIDGRAARLEEILGPWKELAFVQRAEPATWRMADDLRYRFDGVRVPSARHAGGVNLVLWRWNEAGGPRVTFFDPNEELNPWPRP
jgi:RES domain-containing protein